MQQEQSCEDRVLLDNMSVLPLLVKVLYK